MDLVCASDAVAVERKSSRRTVVDNVIGTVMRGFAGKESVRREAPLIETGKDGMIEVDFVLGFVEISDPVDISVAKSGTENEDITAAAAGQSIGSTAAVDLVGAGVAFDGLSELIARQVDRGLAGRLAGRELFDVRASR